MQDPWIAQHYPQLPLWVRRSGPDPWSRARLWHLRDRLEAWYTQPLAPVARRELEGHLQSLLREVQRGEDRLAVRTMLRHLGPPSKGRRLEGDVALLAP